MAPSSRIWITSMMAISIIGCSNTTEPNVTGLSLTTFDFEPGDRVAYQMIQESNGKTTKDDIDTQHVVSITGESGSQVLVMSFGASFAMYDDHLVMNFGERVDTIARYPSIVGDTIVNDITLMGTSVPYARCMTTTSPVMYERVGTSTHACSVFRTTYTPVGGVGRSFEVVRSVSPQIGIVKETLRMWDTPDRTGPVSSSASNILVAIIRQ
jgi:hypothetical protein